MGNASLGAFTEIGVEAIVKDLANFKKDMGDVDKTINSIIPSNTILGRSFNFLGDIISNLTGSVLRTFEYVLGNLIAGAIQAVVSQITEFIQASFEMSNELSRLEVRLNGLNLPTVKDDIQDWSKAMEEASVATAQQLDWLQKLAVAAPFGPAQIADIYTAARSMNLADEEARSLTTSILEFAAGMGLTDAQAERIILNLRQMGTAGKVTGREMTDLARGALLPLDDVLDRMAVNMGISKEALRELISTAEGVDPQLFITAFEEMVEQEPRFVGSMGRLGRTFEFATKNFKEFLANLGARNILMPVLNELGESIATITDQFVTFSETGELIHTEKWTQAFEAATRVGDAIVGVIDKLFGLAPTAEGIADGIVSGLEGLADWFDSHGDDIVKWVQRTAGWFQNVLLPAVQSVFKWLFGTSTQSSAFEKFGTWLENSFIPLVQRAAEWVGNVLVPFLRDDLAPTFEALVPLGEALAGVLLTALGTKPDASLSEFIHNVLIPAIQSLTLFINENQESLAGLFKAFVIIQAVLGVVGVLISGLIGFLTTLGVWIFTITTLLAPLAALLGTTVAGAITIVVAAVIGLIAQFKVLEFAWRTVTGAMRILSDSFINHFTQVKSRLTQMITEIVAAFRGHDWAGIGRAIVSGILSGVQMMASSLIGTVGALARNALGAAKSTLGIRSPSKEFENIGEQIVSGMAQGIIANADIVAKAMKGVAGSTIQMGMIAPQVLHSSMVPSSSVTNNNNNNFNLHINSNANQENIVSDFNMMQSLAGV